MRAGKLRQRVTLQRESNTTDAFGQVRRAWTDVGVYFAEVRPLNGRERVIAEQLRADASLSVTLRYVGPIATRDRLLYRDRTLNLVAVANRDERRRELNLLCTEVV